MIYIQLFEMLFKVDLHSPAAPARWLVGGTWGAHGLTNEEVLFNSRSEKVDDTLVEAVQTFRRFLTAA